MSVHSGIGIDNIVEDSPVMVTVRTPGMDIISDPLAARGVDSSKSGWAGNATPGNALGYGSPQQPPFIHRPPGFGHHSHPMLHHQNSFPQLPPHPATPMFPIPPPLPPHQPVFMGYPPPPMQPDQPMPPPFPHIPPPPPMMQQFFPPPLPNGHHMDLSYPALPIPMPPPSASIPIMINNTPPQAPPALMPLYSPVKVMTTPPRPQRQNSGDSLKGVKVVQDVQVVLDMQIMKVSLLHPSLLPLIRLHQHY